MYTYNFNNTYDKRIEQCREIKSKELYISGEMILEIPKEIKYFDWLEELIIENTGIKNIHENTLPLSLKKLNIQYNDIVFLNCSVLPITITSLICSNNNIIDIIGLNEGIIEIDVSGNKLSTIHSILPKSLKSLDISSNKMLTELPNLTICNNLESLNISNTGIINIDSIPDTIKNLISYKCNIKIINKLPKELILWSGYMSSLEKIKCKFPKKLEIFDMYSNNLITVPKFPSSIKIIDLSRNYLKMIPEFPNTVNTVNLKLNHDIKMNDIKKLQKKLLNTSVELYIDNNEYNTELSNVFYNLSKKNKQKDKIIDDTSYSSSNPHYITCTFKKIYKV
jgi:Leucine-rich repeat (LRR) protein